MLTGAVKLDQRIAHSKIEVYILYYRVIFIRLGSYSLCKIELEDSISSALGLI